MEFKFRQSEMEEVVQMVYNNELEVVRLDSHLIQLPDKYRQLSVGGGQVIVEEANNQKAVFFYTFRGTPDGQEGFVFLPTGTKLKDLEGQLYNELIDSKDVTDNWHFISTD